MKKVGITLLGVFFGIISFLAFQYLKDLVFSSESGEITYKQIDWRDLRELDFETMSIPPEIKKKLSGHVKLPGFIVNTDNGTTFVDEFLFVPSQGACIHTPPPPPNLMVLVDYPQKLDMTQSWGPKWLYGKISFERSENQYGSAGWKFYPDKMEDYSWEEDEAN